MGGGGGSRIMGEGEKDKGVRGRSITGGGGGKRGRGIRIRGGGEEHHGGRGKEGGG